ncbi:hypothetical protein ACFYZ8_23360 [Streptomyces sp. NPDC001668]|uniref:hypothetical protein n=1 Tax=unclassified Streptomyces TaxID=2593676 RepID=UPI0036A036D0
MRRGEGDQFEEKPADAKKLLSLPRIVAICDATRFMTEMNGAEAFKVRLDDLHRAKIRLADEVLVLGDHIGDSTRAENAYALVALEPQPCEADRSTHGSVPRPHHRRRVAR